MKKILLSLTAFSMLFILTACSKTIELSENQFMVDQWIISVNQIETQTELDSESIITLYTGETQTIQNNEVVSEGNQWLIIDVTILENSSTSYDFVSSNFILVDEQGNEYPIINSAFLETYNYETLRTEAIKYGEEKGAIVFEIPNNLTSATLKYEDAEIMGSINISW